MFEDDDSGLLSRSAGLQIPDVSKNLTAFIFKRQEGVKNKVRPRTGYEGPEGDYRYRSTLSLTSALDGGEWLTPHLGRSIPGKRDLVPIVQDATWAPGTVWISAKNFRPTGIRSLDCPVRSEALPPVHSVHFRPLASSGQEIS